MKNMITIDRMKMYTAHELMQLGVFQTRDLRSATRKILEDRMLKKPILNGQIVGNGRGRRYYVLGKNALKYLKLNGS